MHLISHMIFCEKQCAVCDPAKIFLTSKFSYYLFPTSPTKLKLGLQIGGRLQLAKHSIRKREQQSDHICYTLLWQVLGFAVLFASLSKLCKSAGSKSLCWAKLACFDFFSSNFNLPGHILSTGGVAFNDCSLLILTLISCSSLFIQMLCS